MGKWLPISVTWKDGGTPASPSGSEEMIPDAPGNLEAESTCRGRVQSRDLQGVRGPPQEDRLAMRSTVFARATSRSPRPLPFSTWRAAGALVLARMELVRGSLGRRQGANASLSSSALEDVLGIPCRRILKALALEVPPCLRASVPQCLSASVPRGLSWGEDTRV